jgi:predicted permease
VTRLRLLLRRLAASLGSRRLDQDLRDEIAGHLAEATDEYVRRGLSPADARLAALRSFGGVSQVEQAHREVRSLTWIDDLRLDLRHTRRSFVRHPGFASIATLTLALGIGSATTIFTLLDAVVFKPLPVPRPGELFTFYENAPDGTPDASGGSGRYLRFSYPRFQTLQRALGSDGVLTAMTRNARLIARLPGDTQRSVVEGQFVSGGYFATFGVPAAFGRTLTADDVRPGEFVAVAVISDSFWRKALNGSPSAIGQTMVLNDVAVTIVGIAPPGFFGAWSDAEADAWLPLTLQQPMHYQSNRSSYGVIDPGKSWLDQEISWLNLVTRIPDGDAPRLMPRLQAGNRAGLRALTATMADPKERAGMLTHTLAAEPFAHGFSGLRARFADALFALTGMVALLLIVTCANIANLLLARAAAQARDISIRLSLGATTARLIRQSLTESLTLAAIGGAAGVWLSHSASAMLARQVIGTAGRLPLTFAPDARVLGFAVMVSVGAAIVFGLAPALRAIGAGRRAALGGTERQAVGGAPLRGMPVLVIGQLALSLVLVSAAMLLGRTLVNFMRIDPGFAADRIVTVYFDPVTSGYTKDQLPGLVRRLVASAQSVPGVEGAAVSMCGLVNGCSWTTTFRVEGSGSEDHAFHANRISPGYFSTVGIPLVAGREFSAGDTVDAPRVAIVNESIATKYFPGQNPIGRRLGASRLDLDIIGVVRDARTQSLHDPAVPMVYIPIEQPPAADRSILTNLDVRIAGSAATVAAALPAAIHQADPNLLVGEVGPMSQRLSRDLSRERIVAWLAFAFGVMTLLLAALGLYGVLSYGVARRTQEIGVRMALGARRVEVLALVAGQSARLTVAGLLLGLLAARAGSGYLSGMLFGVDPLDPATLVTVTLAFVVVTALASYIPARRATRVDPLIALRCD